jgi:hypothetical protein
MDGVNIPPSSNLHHSTREQSSSAIPILATITRFKTALEPIPEFKKKMSYGIICNSDH